MTTGELVSLGKDLRGYFRCSEPPPTDLFWIQFNAAGEIPENRWKPLLLLFLFIWSKKQTNKQGKLWISGRHIYFSFNVKMLDCFPALLYTPVIAVIQSCLLNQFLFVIFSLPHLQNRTARSLEFPYSSYSANHHEDNASWLVVSVL